MSAKFPRGGGGSRTFFSSKSISLSCLLIKPAKIFSLFASKTDIFIFRYILVNACLAIS